MDKELSIKIAAALAVETICKEDIDTVVKLMMKMYLAGFERAQHLALDTLREQVKLSQQ